MRNGWRLREILERDPRHARYAEEMAELQRKTRVFRPKVELPPGVVKGTPEYDAFILSQQAKSTQSILELHKDPNYKGRDWTAPIPDNYLANPNAQTKEELVGERLLTREEIGHFEAIRRRPKNSDGQSMLGTSKERKEKAIHHFMVSPPAPAPQDKERITQLKKIEEYKPPKEVWRSLSWSQALIHWLKGGKVVKKEINNSWILGYYDDET